MHLPFSAVLVLVIVFGFLSASTVYFYQKSRNLTASKKQTSSSFQSKIPAPPTDNAQTLVDQLTKPAEPRGRLSYPANVYVVEKSETLFTIGEKFDLPWQIIKQANGIINENLIQAGFVLAIPKLDQFTEFYRLNFLINEAKATDLNRELREVESHELFSSTFVAERDAVPYFGITADNSFTLLEEDLSKGTAVVEAKGAEATNLVGLVQPRVKGKKGFWALLYVERR